MKQWIINTPDEKKAEQLAEAAGLTKLAAEVLLANGCEDEAAARRLFGDGKLSDPFLIKDMKKAADEINRLAFEENQKVCVYGDYDCDGVCASVVLYSYLFSNGADVKAHINSREQGFGLNADVIRELAKQDIKLIITVDNGIAAIDEAELIHELGMNLIITDHHEVGSTLPRALAVVDPHRDNGIFNDYCGCGVAMLLVAALMSSADEDGTDAALEAFADLTALATVADMVPLVGENRLLVNHGLHYLESTENLGLKALIKIAGVKPPVTTTHLGFALGPRINAAGRLAHARLAFDLLTCEDTETAERLASEIDDLNTRRKTIEADVKNELIDLYRTQPDIAVKLVQCINLPDANHGVIGLAAGKLLEHTGKPAFLCTDDGEDGLRGSARSVPGFSVFNALTACADCLTKYGGHTLAGGFSLKKSEFERFAQSLERFAATLPPLPPGSVEVCKRLTPSEITTDNACSLDELEPYGQGFSRPLFLITGATVTAISPSSDGKHTKLNLKYDNVTISTVSFGVSPENFRYKIGDKIDLLTYFGIRSFGGRDYLSFRLFDIRLSGIHQQKTLNAFTAYESWRRGEYTGGFTNIIPTREEFAIIYRQLTAHTINIDALYERNKDSFNFFKLRVILDAFRDAKLIKLDLWDQTVTRVDNPAKADLNATETMKRFGS
jgi:single-stranded-DNA-specific exonuclease